MTPVVANTRLNPNYPTQAAIHSLMESGFYDEHLQYLEQLYRPRMEASNRAAANFLSELEIPQLRGGFFVGLWLPGIADEQPFIEAMDRKGVLMAPAQVFAPGWKEKYYTDHQGVFFRLTFPAQSPEANEKGIQRIAEAYQEMRSR
jgi:DNA-binding transcriptional MocR family regulator